MYAAPGQPGHLAPGQFERIAKALADPRRFRLLQTIAEGNGGGTQECPYQRLCERVPVTKATVSHHLKELVNAGLVETEKEGQFVHVCLVPGVMEAYSAELLRRVGGGAGGPTRG